ncbi:MAG TPA: hypothetical protein VKR52_08490 [Terracidiphilus sp.]|nr:hypothetical protein [Terracidiphilus sp.]
MMRSGWWLAALMLPVGAGAQSCTPFNYHVADFSVQLLNCGKGGNDESIKVDEDPAYTSGDGGFHGRETIVTNYNAGRELRAVGVAITNEVAGNPEGWFGKICSNLPEGGKCQRVEGDGEDVKPAVARSYEDAGMLHILYAFMANGTTGQYSDHEMVLLTLEIDMRERGWKRDSEADQQKMEDLLSDFVDSISWDHDRQR